MSTSESLESMTMLGYMEGGIKAANTIKIANQLALSREVTLDYPAGPNVIMRVLIRRRKRQKRES